MNYPCLLLMATLPYLVHGQLPTETAPTDSVAAVRDSARRQEAWQFYRAAYGLAADANMVVDPDTVTKLNLQLLVGPIDLTALRRFPAVEDLALPYYVADTGPLTDGSYTQLKYLDASNGNVDAAMVRSWHLPSVTWLNVAESGVETLGCLAGFTQLATLVLARGQIPTDELVTYQTAHPEVHVLLQGQQRRLPRRFTQADLSSWIAEKLTDPRKAGEPSGRVDIRFVIGPDGRVTEAVVLASLSSATDTAALRVVKGLRFEQGNQADTRTAYIYYHPR